MAKTPEGKLSPDALYLGDNGRCFCGALRCAGMTAYYSGKDLSGQAVERLSSSAAREYGLRCEGCGRGGARGGSSGSQAPGSLMRELGGHRGGR